jgi:hypothetical protein
LHDQAAVTVTTPPSIDLLSGDDLKIGADSSAPLALPSPSASLSLQPTPTSTDDSITTSTTSATSVNQSALAALETADAAEAPAPPSSLPVMLPPISRPELEAHLRQLEVLEAPTVLFANQDVMFSYLVLGNLSETVVVFVAQSKLATQVKQLEWAFTLPSNLVAIYTADTGVVAEANKGSVSNIKNNSFVCASASASASARGQQVQ